MVNWFSDFKMIGQNEIVLLAQLLKGWTEIPLSPGGGYNKEKVCYYDAHIGSIIRDAEELLSGQWNGTYDSGFLESWKYQGKLFRVIHPSPHEDKRYTDGYRLALPKIDYHRMISHWTDDYTFSGLMYKLSDKVEYIILEAETGNHIAFDVNGFRRKYGFEERYTEKEREFIFPMYKECIKEYRMSIAEFVRKKQEEDTPDTFSF